MEDAMGGRINGNRKKKESIKQKWLGSMFCIGSLLLFVSVSGFRMEEEAVETMFDTSSEYMVLSLLENEMEVLRREEKNIDVSRLPEYVTRYPELYAPEINSGGEEKDASGSLSSDNEQGVAKKIAYLTFDDGPSEQTATVLDILKEEGIHATFFLVGEEITAETEEIVKRMVEEGHTVGLHTYSHDYEFIYRSVDNFLSDYEKLYRRLFEVTGQKTSIFRFPGGSTNRYGKAVISTLKKEMERRGFCFYDWNVSAEDMVGTPTRYSIRSNIFKDVFRYDEPVILMHDAAANALTVSMLKDIIEEIRKGGYDFDTLDHRERCQF
jgi:peptidoglycan/xylan/chitin deacetylase (PgdA/CDA1 family)